MPDMAQLMEKVETTYHELKTKVEDIDLEQKRIQSELVSKGAPVPAEEKAAIDARNQHLDELLEEWQEQRVTKERNRIFGGYDSPAVKKESDGTKAMFKLLRGVKADSAIATFSEQRLTPEELSHISYKHMPTELKALYAGDATSGGFFASVDFQMELQKYQILVSPVRSIAKTIMVSGEKLEYPNLLNDTSAYYATEQSSFAYSGDPSLGMLNIPVHEMRGFLQLSQQNLEDSMFPLESFLKERLGMKFGQREGTAFIRGTGNGQPRGIMNYSSGVAAQAYNFTNVPTGKQTGLTYIPYIPSGFATGIGQGDCLINALHDLKQVYAANAKWCLTRTSVGVLRLIKDSQNRPLWQPFAGDNLPATIYDLPYITMPDMDEIGVANNFPILLGDFSHYVIADRAGVTFNIRQLDELFALQGLVGFIARNRHGADVLIPEAFRVIKLSVL